MGLDGEDAASVRRRRLLVLAWTCWALGVLAHLHGIASGFTLSADGPTVAQQQRALVGLTVGLALTIGASAGGLLLAAAAGRRVATASLAVALVLALVPAAFVGPGVVREWRDRLAPEPTPAGPNGCVVFSGGTNTCPGG